MTYYLALLRGINVGGNTKVPMKELKAAMDDAGFEQITSYLQSGNVLFESDETDRQVLAERLRTLVEDQFGTRTPVVMRTFPEIQRILARNPFLDDEDELKLLHTIFLDREPDEATIEQLDPERAPGDRFLIDGQEIYLHYPNGSGRSKLTIDYFERILGVTGTARNWNTVTKLHSLMEAYQSD